jgi:hypothetical protein
MSNVTVKQAHDAARLLWGAISSEDDKYDDALNLLQYFINQNPTPVQGEALPVVGTVQHLNELNDEWLDKLPIGMTLTDHAQATAEIARLQGANAALKQRLGEFSDECFTLRTQLSDATGQVGRLRDGLKHALAASVNAQMVIVKELPAHNWIPGLEKDIEAARAALNSTAPKE